ncbi:30S ribosomal protein S12 methylthiotransferase RimO [Paludicola sp. MB14-C6]|uniref:30S ribosomal protein S12 methylthiotransferase RimO n=1 Tax=Paludihabitans sp. MB14-C6 TaxID=3070656 RepID=UPI0027DD059A|nr:30S ribosomal protein S12 methylthiotransferase RimO [Paludicola sp. MB14-C6]WMJ22453.1 30S ribosomal protein S12 methylthiotransferase RimO [Paludicola sp. MB14-C6]
MAKKVSMVSLGCSKNQVDAEMLLAKLKNNGYELTGDVSESDAVVVNTCGFIQSAKEEAIENILELAELKKEGTIQAIIVTGCLAQRYQDELVKEFPEVDAILGIGSNDQICDAVNKALNHEQTVSFGNKESLCLNGDRILTTLPHYAYLKVAEGCDNWCSYCAIPMIRGRFRSRPKEEVIKEAQWLASQGVKEVIVVAQDTTRYGEDLYGSYQLAALLKELAKIEGIEWIRPLYCYPDKITNELLEVIANEPKVVKYLDIPIQHCNKEILRAMNRKQDKETLVALFKKIREKVEGITLRTTLITGFPGETDEQFTELCEFVDEIQFDRLGCFTYSPEEGTKAAEMDCQIDDDVKERRAEIIMNQQAIIMERLNEQKINSTIRVIVEGFDKYGECYFGRSEADAPDIDGKVFFTSETSYVMGDFVNVHIDEVMDYDLIGTVI